MKYDVVIIGAGLGGLTCGRLLTKAGMRVLVLEQGRQVGGCLQSYRRHGLDYDTGFHYVGGLAEGQMLHRVFSHLGLMQLPWHRLDPEGFDRVTLGNREYRFAEGFCNFANRLADDFPRERRALNRYAGMLMRSEEEQLRGLKVRSGLFPFLGPPNADGLRNYAWLTSTRAYAYLRETFHNSLLRNVVSGTSLKMELRRQSLPLFTFAHGNASFIASSWRLRGGGGLIADTLARGILHDGGEVVCGARVEELTVRNGCIEAARCANGETYEARCFISSLHPATTCALVREGLRPSFVRRITALENTCGMLTVSLRLRPRTVRYFNWNQYVYRQPNVWTFHEEAGRVGGVMVSCRVPSGTDAEWAEQIDLLTPMPWERWRRWEATGVGRRGDDYVAMKHRLADECIALAERFLPRLADHIGERYVSTPLTYRDYTLSPEGSAYGIRKDFRQPLATLLSPRTPVANLLLTGQSLTLHGLQGTTMTALHTCAEAVGLRGM